MINGDDQKYILKHKDCPISAGDKDAKYMQTFLERWISFVTDGDPKNGWTDFKENKYLRISEDTKLLNFGYEKIKFWEKTFP